MHKNKFLIVAAICSGVAALLHFGCIIFGGNWYRFFGAGEQMAQMAEAGHFYPANNLVALCVIWCRRNFKASIATSRVVLNCCNIFNTRNSFYTFNANVPRK